MRKLRAVSLPAPILSVDQKRFWNENGFLVLPGFFSNDETKNLRDFIETCWNERHSDDNPIVIDSKLDHVPIRKRLKDAEDSEKNSVYKLNDAFLISGIVRNAALDQRLTDVLEELCGGSVCICNSLIFERGSQQDLHVDTYYMPAPQGSRLIVTSICLENVAPEAGPVAYVPKSHLIPPFRNSSGTTHARDKQELDIANRYYQAQIAERGLPVEHFCGSEGDVLIWHEQLVHGGSEINDFSLTRKSLVTHYWRYEQLDGWDTLPHLSGHYLNREHQKV
jgi:ectoine hydroxylase-related dioxygenase (phytanoyl-CoA dioxygenase family)